MPETWTLKTQSSLQSGNSSCEDGDDLHVDSPRLRRSTSDFFSKVPYVALPKLPKHVGFLVSRHLHSIGQPTLKEPPYLHRGHQCWRCTPTSAIHKASSERFLLTVFEARNHNGPFSRKAKTCSPASMYLEIEQFIQS